MPLFVWKEGRYDPKRDMYLVRDAKCIGCECFIPGERRLKEIPLSAKPLYNQSDIRICTTLHDDTCPEDTNYSKIVWMNMIDDGWRSRAI